MDWHCFFHYRVVLVFKNSPGMAQFDAYMQGKVNVYEN